MDISLEDFPSTFTTDDEANSNIPRNRHEVREVASRNKVDDLHSMDFSAERTSCCYTEGSANCKGCSKHRNHIASLWGALGGYLVGCSLCVMEKLLGLCTSQRL